MKVAMVQMTASTVAIQENEKLIMSYCAAAVAKGAHLICFPEMALIGYSFEDLSERLLQQKQVIKGLHQFSKETGLSIIIGGIEADEGQYYIAQFVIDKEIDSYRKIHIGQKERSFVVSGDTIKVFDCQGIKLGLILCYDGHFPELVTIMAEKGAQLILNPSASPNKAERRVAMWRKYLIARAYDNRLWVAATNLRFKGKGGGILVVDGDGQEVAASTEDKDDMIIFDYVPGTYSSTSMMKRDFKIDRRQDIYDKYR